MVMAIFLPP
jgi:hypothetical protein